MDELATLGEPGEDRWEGRRGDVGGNRDCGDVGDRVWLFELEDPDEDRCDVCVVCEACEAEAERAAELRDDGRSA
jgi:hypothetical protein